MARRQRFEVIIEVEITFRTDAEIEVDRLCYALCQGGLDDRLDRREAGA
jgi:hypothetical protein